MESKKNKLLLLLLAVAIACGLWMYVITVVSPGSQETFRDIRVELTSKAVLEGRKLYVYDENPTVTLTLTGNRIDLNKLSSSNIMVTVDMSRIYEAGDHELQYSISYPGSVASGAITVKSRDPGYLILKVEDIIEKELVLENKSAQTKPAEGFEVISGPELTPEKIKIIGPSSVINRIEKAYVDLKFTGKKESIDTTFTSSEIILADKSGKIIDEKDRDRVTFEKEEVRAVAEIYRVLDVPVHVPILYGGGATEENTQITYPQNIRVWGEEAAIDAFAQTLNADGVMVLEQIDLSRVKEAEGVISNIEEVVYNIKDKLTDGVNLMKDAQGNEPSEELKVNIAFTDLEIMEIMVQNFEIDKCPEGLEAEVNVKELEVMIRGPKDAIVELKREDLKAIVDLTGAKAGNGEYPVTVVVDSTKFPTAGPVYTDKVPATVKVTVEEKK